MLVRFVNLSTAPVAIPSGQQYLTVTGLGITTFTPNGVIPTLMGDGSAGITIESITGLTTDGFTVTFSSPVPNGSWSISFFIF